MECSVGLHRRLVVFWVLAAEHYCRRQRALCVLLPAPTHPPTLARTARRTAPPAEDPDRAREVYRACLKLLPHQRGFTFGKVWIMAAQFEVRQLRLDAARKILGMALGMCPKVRRC